MRTTCVSLALMPGCFLVLSLGSCSFGSCGGEASTATSTVVAQVSTTTAPTTTAGTEPTTTTTNNGGTLSDGVYFGFIRQVADDAVVFDPAVWLSGESALNAARADGVVGPTEDLPNPFYIDNPDAGVVTVQVDLAARFTLLAYDSTGTPAIEKTVSHDELAHLWAGGDDDDLYYSDFALHELPINLTVFGRRVIAGKEQYIP